MSKKIKVTGIECPKCGEFIWSRHVHDFRACSCGHCTIDGGREYTKISYADGECPKPIDKEVEKEPACDYRPRFPY